MKTYPFEYEGQDYALTGLTEGVKNKFCQPIRAEMLNNAKGLLQDGLIDALVYADLTRSALSLGYNSEPVVRDLGTPEGHRRLLKLLVVGGDKLPAAVLDGLCKADLDPSSSLAQAMALVMADAYPDPKAMPPASTA